MATKAKIVSEKGKVKSEKVVSETPKIKKVSKVVEPKVEKKVEAKVVAAAVVEKVEKVVDAPKEVKEFEKLPSLKDMLEAGVHFGHSIKHRNPRMDDYVYAVKNGVQIFDLVQTRSIPKKDW